MSGGKSPAAIFFSLFLAAEAPGGGAAADGFAAERSFVFGAGAFGGPALVEKPGFGRVAEVFADFVECFA